jgi:hypothetical protein
MTPSACSKGESSGLTVAVYGYPIQYILASAM